MLIFLDDGCAHIVDNEADGVMSYPDAIYPEMVAISCSQEPPGDGQLQTRVECIPLEGIFLASCWFTYIEQLPEHSRFHSHTILESRSVLNLKFTHQPLILHILLSPLQPQPHPPSPSPPCAPSLVQCNGYSILCVIHV